MRAWRIIVARGRLHRGQQRAVFRPFDDIDFNTSPKFSKSAWFTEPQPMDEVAAPQIDHAQPTVRFGIV
jgi:hypothetical protein